MSTSANTAWGEWVRLHRLPEELFEAGWLEQEFAPSAADRKAAWRLYTELRTRIATQPLHYRAGDEGRAAESLSELFGLARGAMHESGVECRNFAVLATVVLNGVVRPFTAKWHKRIKSGDLELEYVRHEFRAELAQLQLKLLPFQRALGHLAEGDKFVPETATAERAAGPGMTTAQQQLAAEEVGWWPAAAKNRKRMLLGERGTDGALDRPVEFALNLPERVPPEQCAAIEELEEGVIRERRAAVGLEEDSRDPIGLAISGGGIRSATFALGVLQRLAHQGLLREIDLLSTVSGGGYLGSFLSSYLNSPTANPAHGARQPIGLGAGELPFLGPNDNESAAVRWMRNRSKYLLFGGRIRRLQIYGLAIYGVLINLFVTLPLIALLVLLTQLTYGDRLAQLASAASWPPYPAPGWPSGVLWTVLGAAGVIAFLLGPIQMWFSRHDGWRKTFLRKYERVAVWLLPILLIAVLVNLVPIAAYAVHRLLHAFDDPWTGRFALSADQAAAAGTAAAAVLPVLAAAASYLARNRRVIGGLMRGLFALSGPLFFLTAYFLLVNWAIVESASGSPENATSQSWLSGREQWVLGGLFLVPAVYGLWFLNVNFSSPHRFYRNRLSDAYLVQDHEPDASAQTAVERTKPVDAQKLSELRSNNKAVPYHLINTALNVPGSTDPDLRGRDCDFFLFSQGYCGSVLTGYVKTDELQDLDWRIDLGTAMAISGAAAAPYMGVHSVRAARFLLTLLNIRLGYWLPNPACDSRWCRTLRFWFPANATYLFREMFGWLKSNRSRVYLSDGGHIENLGLYELLRRRCKFIIAIDGEQDNELARQSLMRVMRYAAIDLNADIRFPDLHDLTKDARGFSASHFALGVIRYQPSANHPNDDIGLILYIKSSLTGNEPATVLDYQRRHPEFPHETTADQFFEEEQFEAYRALGYHVADEGLRPELFDGPPPTDLDTRAWFRTLVDKLFPD